MGLAGWVGRDLRESPIPRCPHSVGHTWMIWNAKPPKVPQQLCTEMDGGASGLQKRMAAVGHKGGWLVKTNENKLSWAKQLAVMPKYGQWWVKMGSSWHI